MNNNRILIFVLLLFSCKREPYAVLKSESPEFKMNATIDGVPFVIEAGNSGLYMNASATQNEFGVYEFSCDFNKNDCSSCAPVMRVVINNSASVDPGAPIEEDVLDVGVVGLSATSNTSNFLELHFLAPSILNSTFTWDFGDGITGIGNESSHLYAAAGTYEVVLEIENSDEPENNVVIAQSVLVGNSMFLSLPFTVGNLQDEMWEFSYPVFLPSYLQITGWTINGIEYQGDHLQIESDEDLSVCLNFMNTATNGPGYYCVSFQGDDENSISCLFNYQWEAQDLNVGKAELFYVDAVGKSYTSICSLNESPDASLEIVSAELYPEAIDGSPAKKVVVEFSLWMVNVDDPIDILHFENGSAVLGFVFE